MCPDSTRAAKIPAGSFESGGETVAPPFYEEGTGCVQSGAGGGETQHELDSKDRLSVCRCVGGTWPEVRVWEVQDAWQGLAHRLCEEVR